MTAVLAPIQITLAQVWLNLMALYKTNKPQIRNHLLHDGSFTPFTIVPFNDVSIPTQAPVSSLTLFSK